VLAPSSGLARITIRAPRRRIDLALPHQVPLAELLPEVVLRAGEGTDQHALAATGGWMLRRPDGLSLSGDTPLAGQGVRDGDVLYLVPRNLAWPEPAYDDVVEEVAAGARGHGPVWDAAVTRLVTLVAAGLVLASGLAVVAIAGLGPLAPAVAAGLLTVGVLVSRAGGDGPVGAVAGGWAMGYAAAGAVLLTAGRPAPERLLVGAGALLFTAVVAALAIGYGLAVFTAGVAAGTLGVVVGLLGFATGVTGAAAIALVVLVAAVGLVPLAAVRLARLPLPVVSADPAVVAAEVRPTPDRLRAAVIRADQILAGGVAGLAAAGLVSVALLGLATGVSAPLLAGLGCVAMLLRSRLFPAVAARLPLVGAGVLGLVAVAVERLPGAPDVVRWGLLLVALAVVAALLAAATRAPRRPAGPSPYLGRLADIVDITAVVALAPVACAVLGLYSLVRNLVS
jgi:type VII secretion integral membrane protein EccD